MKFMENPKIKLRKRLLVQTEPQQLEFNLSSDIPSFENNVRRAAENYNRRFLNGDNNKQDYRLKAWKTSR